MLYHLALSTSLMVTAQSAPQEGEVLHLLQLAVPMREETVDSFRAATNSIRTCEGARQVGRTLEAQVVERRSVSLSTLPREIRALLSDLPIGQATPVFGKMPSMKVLVICSRKPAQRNEKSPT